MPKTENKTPKAKPISKARRKATRPRLAMPKPPKERKEKASKKEIERALKEYHALLAEIRKLDIPPFDADDLDTNDNED